MNTTTGISLVGSLGLNSRQDWESLHCENIKEGFKKHKQNNACLSCLTLLLLQ